MAARVTIRTPMSVKIRAKQFAMFDAMKGLTEAIKEKERQHHPQRELTDERTQEINNVLRMLKQGDVVCIEYYCQYGSEYKQISGRVNKIDTYWKVLEVRKTTISFSEIIDIHSV